MTIDILNEADILARTIWGEARGEGRKGMEAVACVIMNRTKNPRWWGKDVLSVCLKPWQFSCWNKKDPNFKLLQTVNSTDPVFFLAENIAEEALDGSLKDFTKGSTHYFADTIQAIPKWALGRSPNYRLGNHIFFREL